MSSGMTDEDELPRLAVLKLRAVMEFGAVIVREIAGWVRGSA